MRRRLRTALGIGAAGSLLLAGCVPGFDRGSWPTPLPSAEQPGATPLSPTPSTPQTVASSSSPTISASPSSSVTVGAYDVQPLPHYSGPRPLPASDGKPMLWPVSTPVSMYSGYQQLVTRSGFLDVTGKMVIPQRYESYQYCTDETGRAVLLIANRDSLARAEVFDLTGKRLATLPTARGDCAGSSYVITTNDGLDEASTRDDVKNGLYELATGKWLIPPTKGLQLTSLRPGLLNVTERTGEYLLDLNSGRKIPHPGWITSSAELNAGSPGLPASTARDGGKVGFVDLSGHWLIKPTFTDAGSFSGDLAIVQPREGSSALIDAKGQPLPGDWTEIDAVTRTVGDGTGYQPVGYLASGPAGQALWDLHGNAVVALGTGAIDCSWEKEGACSLRLADGSAQLISLPDGTPTILPAGINDALSRTFAGTAQSDPDGRGTVYSLVSQKMIETVGRSSCTAAGSAFVVCMPDSDVLPTIVINAGGPTSFSSVTPLTDPGPSGDVRYYQVTTSAYSGIVDASGAWRYRQSSHTRLDD
jgi:hypothetical protein